MSESQWTVMWWLLLFLPVCYGPPTLDRLTLSVPGGPLSVRMGSSIILPCSFSPPFTESLHVRWHRRGEYKTPVLLYEKQQIQEEPTDPKYRGRVSLIGELKRGDVSLKLENVTLADRGKFVCFVAGEKSEDHADIHLTVRAIGSPPVLSVTDEGSGQVKVTCVSDGWSPQPNVTWRIRGGAEIYEQSSDTATDAKGFLTVTSSLLRSSSSSSASSEWISCTVGLSEQESVEGRILPYISGTNTGFWKDVSIAVLVILLLIVGAIALFCVLRRRGHRTATQSQDGYTGAGTFQYEMDNNQSEGARKPVLVIPTLERVKHFKESPTMDEASIQGDLKLGFGGRRVTCSQPIINQTLNTSHYVLCRDIFSSGQHYWEFRVSGKQSWCVGVCSDALRGQGGLSLQFQSDCWLLCFNEGEGLFVNTDPVTPVQAADTLINTVGVFLNCYGHSLLFYEVESKLCLCTFYDVNSNHPLVPVLSPGGRDSAVMALID